MIQKFITVGLKGSTDRFSKGLSAGDVIGGITDLADGGITFLGHNGVLLVPGTTGAAIGSARHQYRLASNGCHWPQPGRSARQTDRCRAKSRNHKVHA